VTSNATNSVSGLRDTVAIACRPTLPLPHCATLIVMSTKVVPACEVGGGL